MSEDLDAGEKFAQEVTNTFIRYSQESDMTTYEAIGALESVKQNIIRINQNTVIEGDNNKEKPDSPG